MEAGWSVGAVNLKETRVDSSTGTLSAELAPASGTWAQQARRFSFDGRGRFDGLSLPDYQLVRGEFTAGGGGALSVRVSDKLDRESREKAKEEIKDKAKDKVSDKAKEKAKEKLPGLDNIF